MTSDSRNQALFAYFPDDIVPGRVQDMLTLRSGLHKYDGESVLLIHAGQLVLLTRDTPNQGFWRVDLVPHHTPRLEDWKTFTRMVVQTGDGEKAVLAAKEDTHRLQSIINAATAGVGDTPARPSDTPTDKQRTWKQPAWARPGAMGRFQNGNPGAGQPVTTAPRIPPTAAMLEPPRPQGSAPGATASQRRPLRPAPQEASPPRTAPLPRREKQQTFWPPSSNAAPASQGPEASRPAVPTRPAPALPAAAGGDVKNRLVFAAKVPRSKLKLMSETAHLEDMTKPYGRGAKVAGQYWVSAIKAASLEAAEQACIAIKAALEQRYPGEVAASWAPYDEPGNVSPNAPPPVVQGLIHYIQLH